MSEMPDNYTVIDIETTGISPHYDDIIELSGLKIRNNKVVDEFSTLVNPKRNVSEFITNLTGITNNMLYNAPDIKNVLPKLVNFIADDIILGHNVRFDIGFIQNKLMKYFNQELTNDSLDTLFIARKVLNLKNYKLSTIADKYNIDTKNNHRGLKDCYITFEVYNNLTGKIQPQYVQQTLL